jgi:hypothetical protein
VAFDRLKGWLMPRIHPAVKQFRARAAEEFAFLLTEFDCREERVPRGKNEFSVRYVNATTRIIVEGINWGANARVALGSAEPPDRFEDFDLLDIVSVRCPDQAPSDVEMARGQLHQLKILADVLRRCGTETLRGDFSVAPQIYELRRQRVEEWNRQQAERARMRGRPREK